ncbi:MAG: class I SAM-dependent methyltransferase [Rhodothermaceae bacterium]|nr:class I SAM-dependent methyltransferase [Rhodothermaceae bacterium]
MEEKDMQDYAAKYHGVDESILGDVVQVTRSSLQYDDMLSGPVVAGLLRFLIHATSARRVLEIGMFTGYGTLAMALSLPEDGRVITCESNMKYINLAKPLFQKSGVDHKIDIQFGEALNSIARLDPWFDLIFLDADKENYLNYYENCLPLLKKGGIFVADNAWLGGKVRDSGDRKGKVVHELNEAIQANENLVNVMLPVRDGIHLALKI